MVARRERGRGGWMKKVSGLTSANWQSENSHGNVKYSIRNTVNNIGITMYSARKVLTIDYLMV